MRHLMDLACAEVTLLLVVWTWRCSTRWRDKNQKDARRASGTKNILTLLHPSHPPWFLVSQAFSLGLSCEAFWLKIWNSKRFRVGILIGPCQADRVPTWAKKTAEPMPGCQWVRLGQGLMVPRFEDIWKLYYMNHMYQAYSRMYQESR